jgi:hypothetical protein
MMIEGTGTRFGLSSFSQDFVTRLKEGQVSRRHLAAR